MIGYGKQQITAEDISAVTEALRSDFLTQGPRVEAFETSVAGYCDARYGVAVANATAALHMAYSALGVGPGDLVWTAPNTFVATANAARFLGADVDFVDVDPVTYNLCPNLLAEKLARAKAAGRLPKLVTPVHFGGQSCDMEPVRELSREYDFRVVEDASHAIGGRYRNVKVGSCSHSDIAVFSFHPVKIITTGEGGLATTNDPELYAAMDRFRTHGITRDPSRMEGEPEGGWWYEMIDLGYNYRITDIQAALGSSQMERLDNLVARRHEIAAIYDAEFADLPITTPHRESWQYSGFHLYVIRWPDGTGGLNRRQAFEAMRAAGLGVNVHYIPVHLQPYYRNLGFKRGDFPNAEAYYDEAITIPLHPSLTGEEISKVVETVRTLALG